MCARDHGQEKSHCRSLVPACRRCPGAWSQGIWTGLPMGVACPQHVTGVKIKFSPQATVVWFEVVEKVKTIQLKTCLHRLLSKVTSCCCTVTPSSSGPSRPCGLIGLDANLSFYMYLFHYNSNTYSSKHFGNYKKCS